MPAQPDLASILDDVRLSMQTHLGKGRVADYIPALARIDPRHFGMAVITLDGECVSCGDDRTAFSIQSISKIFTLCLALNRLGAALWQRVGREPSGSRFNSIVQLEQERGIPRNPLINAGALVVTDALLTGSDPLTLMANIKQFMRQIADDSSIEMDQEVADSEAATGFRNASLANFLRAYNNLENPVEDVLRVYFHQCALSMNCRQLARAGLFLAAGGSDKIQQRKITTPVRARRINALMMSCGHYDASGNFAFRVGLPGKSGVGGGILAIAPRRAAIAVWSPGLNAAGNSYVGTLALERFAALTGWSVF